MVALLCGALAGCTDADWDYALRWPDPSASVAPPAAAHAGVSPDCDRLARARKTDVADQGYDEAVQQKAYESVLADCSKWASNQAP